MMVAVAAHHHIRQITSFLFLLLLLFAWKSSSDSVPVKVGVVLDLDVWAGKLGWSCLNLSLSDFYASHPNYTTRLHLHLRQPGPDVVTAAAAGIISLFLSLKCSLILEFYVCMYVLVFV